MEHSTRITSLAIFASLFLVRADAVIIKNEYCEPRPTLVAMGHPEYKYFPYFVTLHRCGGSCGTFNPNLKGCVELTYTDVQVQSLSFKSNQPKIITARNHTSCGCICIGKKKSARDCNLNYQRWDGPSCECKCLYNNSDPPKPCPAGFRWNRNACQCECTKVPPICTVNKNWSNVDCKCVDVNVGPKRRRLRKRIPNQSEKKGVSSTLLVVFVVVEFAVLYVVFDAILYHRQAGIFYRIQLKLRKQGSTFETSNRDDICREMKSEDPTVTTVTITGKETAI